MLAEVKLKIDSEITLLRKGYIKDKSDANIEIVYKVIAFYAHHVLLKDKITGTKRSVTNAELYQMGLAYPAMEVHIERDDRGRRSYR